MGPRRAGEDTEGGNLSRKRVFEDVNQAEFIRVVSKDAVSARKKKKKTGAPLAGSEGYWHRMSDPRGLCQGVSMLLPTTHRLASRTVGGSFSVVSSPSLWYFVMVAPGS